MITTNESRDNSAATRSLDAWLQYIAAVHPQEIELGLERIRRVAQRLQLSRPARHVITVAGTNGKGSCIACMQAILLAAGYQTAVYTSPHIHRFNERITLSGEPVTDAQLCSAFAAVDRCRASDSLSYFEFATLAALTLFQQASPDIALLEVGLGGRLDAVNIIDPDVAVITSISLDHEHWLGSDLDSIGREKAGILRRNMPAVYGDYEPPASIVQRAGELSAPLYILGTHFSYQWTRESTAAQRSWRWTGSDGADSRALPRLLTELPAPAIACCNAATALQALQLLPLTLSPDNIRQGLASTSLAGRFEIRRDLSTGKTVVFDVAHNPAAAALLATGLRQFREENPSCKSISAVLAVMADKDIDGIAIALESCLDIWYIAQVNEARSMPVDVAARRIGQSVAAARVNTFESVFQAYQTACEQSADGDLVVVTGSFFTVAALRKLSAAL